MNYIISITDPKAHTVLENIHRTLSLPFSVELIGHGTAMQSMLDLLGIESNEKRIMLTVADSDNTKKLISEYKKQLYIGAPGHGVVASVPLKSVGGGKTLSYLNGGELPKKQIPEIDCSHELLVIIANSGMTDTVMTVARSGGASGGTVLHGKGTGKEGDMKFMNVSIASEKEVILIIVKSEHKKEVMQAVLQQAGPETPAGAIVFSLPVSEVAGFGLQDEE